MHHGQIFLISSTKEGPQKTPASAMDLDIATMACNFVSIYVGAGLLLFLRSNLLRGCNVRSWTEVASYHWQVSNQTQIPFHASSS